ncbi:TAXI family TRAP transporter solute-binding subunit [Natrinema sp. H-ect4]|uniref:TAXI family TRAP transporter solute-binding subunit n=1 Tax=Natrinema sp. H-ect4 TaxID=3242699 RepID=UPI0035A98DDC
MVANVMVRYRTVNRREFIGTTGVAGVGFLGGCLNADTAGGDNELVMVSSGEETGTYASSQGIAGTVNQNTEDVFIDARPSGGTDDNVGMMNRGEADIGYFQHNSAQLIMEGKEPYDAIDFTPLQLFHHSDLAWLFVTSNSGWESVTDIESNSKVSPTPSGSGSAPVLEQALNYAVDDYERVSYGFGAQSSAMQEGELDVATIAISNFDFESSWIQEMKQTVDTRILGWPNDAVQEIGDDSLVPAEEFDLSEDLAEGYAYVPDPTVAINIPYNYCTHDGVPYDPVYEMLNVMWENREAMADTHVYEEYLLEDEWWVTRMYDGVPFHPAAADFYEEQGLWRDEFERGEVNE